MNNDEFLKVLEDSFKTYLNTNPRSNEKLKVLHGAIAQDLLAQLGCNDYEIFSINTTGQGKEESIQGRYVNKKVDITIKYSSGETCAGIAVKYIMSNYSQNSNNYFENMLGETANIRSANFPYFQIVIIPSKIPYFDKNKNITKWERISEHHLNKYIKLSKDVVDIYMHTPNKTLLCVVDIISNSIESSLKTQEDYKRFYLNEPFEMRMSPSSFKFQSSVVFNDYETFIQKVSYVIKSI